ncbi:DUF5336 domain-containing protein [Kitasatospora nipponensis]|uniref:DUF5336 domain-containing protein n=1 Tax=Kitasatospora nipponensis TaxID=258049 RepID=A0ABP4HB96_9ACTN
MLLLISSFLPYWSVDCNLAACSSSAWNSNLFPVLPSVYLLGIAAAALILLQRFQGEAARTRQILGLRLDQWGTAFAVAALWTSLWSLGNGSNHSWGAYLGVLSVLVIAGGAVAGPLVPALQAPLVTDKPATPIQQGYPGGLGGYPGAPQGPNQGQFQQPGYGYPTPGAGQPGPGQAPHLGQTPGGSGHTFGGQPQPGGYGFPAPEAGQAPEQSFGQPHPGAQGEPAAGQQQRHDAGFQTPPAVHAAPAPAAAEPTPAPAPAPAVDFAPFWFAVPAPRQLSPKDGSAGPPVGELLPGTWYLAVDQRGTALVAQLQDGTQGVLGDVSGIQRG